MQEENKKDNVKINQLNENVIDIEDFLKIDIRVGTIISVEEVEGSDKLYKLKVDFGETGEIESEGGITEKEAHFRTVFSGIKKFVIKEDLIDRQFPFVINLKPRKIMGNYSEAMILAVSDDENFSLFNINKKIKNGTRAS